MTNYREVSLETRVEILERRIEDLENALEVKNSNKSTSPKKRKIFQILLDEKPDIVFEFSHGLYKCPFCEKYPAGSTGPFWKRVYLPNSGRKLPNLTNELFQQVIANDYSCLIQRTCHYCSNKWVVGKELENQT
jgi:hypothetical protein